MKIREPFFVSDTHFGHARILEFCPNTRKYDNISDHDEALIQAWNKRVDHKDDVYHLGDFAFYPPEKIANLLTRLNGRIHLILGNHDRAPAFEFAQNVVEITTYKEIKVRKKSFVLFHFPIESWNKKHHGAIHLHGHTHGNLSHHPTKKAELRMDVGVDLHKENAPFTVDEIFAYLGVK